MTVLPAASAGWMVFSRWSRRAAVNSSISVSGDQRSGSPVSKSARISSAPGLPPGSRVSTTSAPCARSVFGEAARLGGFARPVDAFKGDETGPAHGSLARHRRVVGRTCRHRTSAAVRSRVVKPPLGHIRFGHQRHAFFGQAFKRMTSSPSCCPGDRGLDRAVIDDFCASIIA